MIQRALNILSSVSLLATIYLINKGVGIGMILSKIGIRVNYDLPQYYSYVVYVVLPVFFAWLLTKLFSKLRPGELQPGCISEISADNSSFLAMILGYIFVGLSINNIHALFVIMGLLLIFHLCGNSYIFNPLFYLFGYRYYYLTSSGIKFLVMTKQRINLGANGDFSKSKCLNDFTYIDID